MTETYNYNEHTLFTLIIGWIILLLASHDRLNRPAKMRDETQDLYDEIVPVYLSQSRMFLVAFLSYAFVITVIYILGCVVVDITIKQLTGAATTSVLPLSNLTGGGQGPTVSPSNDLQEIFMSAWRPFASMDKTVPLITCLALIGFGVNLPILSAGDYFARKLAHRSIGVPHSIRDIANTAKGSIKYTEASSDIDRLLERHVPRTGTNNRSHKSNDINSPEEEEARFFKSIRNAFEYLNDREKNRIYSIIYWHDMLDNRVSAVRSEICGESKKRFPEIWRDADTFTRFFIRNLDRKDSIDIIKDEKIDEILDKICFLVAFDVHHSTHLKIKEDNGVSEELILLLKESSSMKIPTPFIVLLVLFISSIVGITALFFGFFLKQLDISTMLPNDWFGSLTWALSCFVMYFISFMCVFWIMPDESLHVLRGHAPRNLNQSAKMIITGLVGALIGFYFIDIVLTLIEGQVSVIPSERFIFISPFSFLGALSIIILLSANIVAISTSSGLQNGRRNLIDIAKRDRFFILAWFAIFFMAGFVLVVTFQLIKLSPEGTVNMDIPMLLIAPIIIGLEAALLALGFRFYREMSSDDDPLPTQRLGEAHGHGE